MANLKPVPTVREFDLAHDSLRQLNQYLHRSAVADGVSRINIQNPHGAHSIAVGLNAELDDHVGYQPYAVEGRGSGNSRDGSYPKTVITEIGPVEVQMPCDRQGTFQPVTVPKHVRRLDGLTGNVISLYAKRRLPTRSMAVPPTQSPSGRDDRQG